LDCIVVAPMNETHYTQHHRTTRWCLCR